MDREPTTREVMDAVLELRDAVSSGFARVEKGFARVEREIRALDGRLGDFRNDMTRHFSRIDDWFDRFEAKR